MFLAMRRGSDGAPEGNYCAFNLVYEDGHAGDHDYICGLAELRSVFPSFSAIFNRKMHKLPLFCAF